MTKPNINRRAATDYQTPGLRQSGVTTAEYLVVTVVVIAMLFLPVPGHGESVMDMMIQGFKDSHHHYVWGMSYPL